MNETHCFFDFQTCQTRFGRPDPERLPYGWLLVTDAAQLSSCEQKLACLLSLKTDTGHPLLLRGEASGFIDALRFFENLAADRISARLPDRLICYWADLNDRRTSATDFALERAHFGRQFRLNEPRLGLEGFLNKNRTPFNNGSAAKAAAQQVAGWISRTLENGN